MSNIQNDNSSNQHYDLVIIGAGMVGITLLSSIIAKLDNANFKIAIIDKKFITNDTTADLASSYRTTALNYNTKCIYEDIGLWEYFSSTATAIDQVIVKEELNASCSFAATKEQVPALGYIVPHSELQHSLQSHLLKLVKENNNISLLESQSIKKLQHHEHSIEINLASATANKITAKLAVIADGGNSTIINQLGIYYQTTDYQQTAIICKTELNHPNKNIAYEYFTNSSSIALLPYKQNKAGIVWAAANSNLNYYKEMSNDQFLENLQNQFGNEVQVSFNSISDRFYYPMKMNLASEQVAPNLVILGSSAHFIHPIAAQGYNLSVKCCALLVKNIQQSLQQNINIGSLTQLLQYKQAAIKEQQPIISFCDYTVKAFSLKSQPVKYLRSLALKCLDNIKPAKSYFTRKAMGL